MAHTKEEALKDHQAEIDHLVLAKELGTKMVDAAHYGLSENLGCEIIPIDDMIKWWAVRLEKIQAGEDPELFNY